MNSDAAAYFPNALTSPSDVCEPSRRAPQPASDLSDSTPSQEAAVESSTQSVVPISEISDEQLLKRVGTGDREALSILFRRHARLVFNLACRILRDESEAEDLLQELFLFLFQKSNIFDETKSSGVSWIVQMAYHRAIDRRRYLDVRHHYTAQEFHEEQLLTTMGQPAIDEFAGGALLERFRAELSAEQRQSLEMHLFEGYSFREIADRTGQTFGNVRNHYYRGLERLRSHIFPGK